MATKLPSILAGLVLSTMVAGASHAITQPEVDPTTNPFYKFVPNVSTMERGQIIRTEIAELDDSVFHGATGVRVMYVSENLDGSKAAATMMVFYPGTDTPPASDGQWRTMVWATGTVGPADVCANSRYRSMYQQDEATEWGGRWKPYGDVINHMIERGHIVVAPDYIGTGPEDNVHHAWLVDGAKSPAIIDGVIASRALFEMPEHLPALNGAPISPELGVLGHSNGGIAAHQIVTAIEAYGDPDLQLVGVAPFSDPGRSVVYYLESAVPQTPGPLNPYVLYLARAIEVWANLKGYPFEKSELVPSPLYDLAEADGAWDFCFDKLFEEWAGTVPEPIQNITPDWATNSTVEAYIQEVEIDTSYSPVPRFINYSKHDDVSLDTPNLINELCSNSNSVYVNVLASSHDNTLQNVPEAMDWFGFLFDGILPHMSDLQHVDDGCNVPQ
jgi:hypothetical protein